MGKINGDKDVVYVEAMLKAAKYKEVNITRLVNGQATKNGIVKAFKGLVSQCKVGDIVYVHYSGHGQQMKDVHNDERMDWTSVGYHTMPIASHARKTEARSI